MAGASWHAGDRAILDFATEPTRVKITKPTKAGYIYVQNVVTQTTYKVHGSRLSSLHGAVYDLWHDMESGRHRT